MLNFESKMWSRPDPMTESDRNMQNALLFLERFESTGKFLFAGIKIMTLTNSS